MSTSPDAGRGRVIRGGVASRASALAFPVIETIEVEPSSGDRGSPPTFATALHLPAIDPDELERARLEASARGYADGLAAGRDEARAEVLAAAQGLLGNLAAAVQQQAAQRTATLDELSDDLVRFAYGVVESLLGRELELAAAPAVDAVRAALRLAPDRGAAQVLVHPDDVAVVAAAREALGTREIDVVADSSIGLGGCVVRVGECEIDARIDAALERVRTVLTEHGSVAG
jgi:flagellar assembly protein FliH